MKRKIFNYGQCETAVEPDDDSTNPYIMSGFAHRVDDIDESSNEDVEHQDADIVPIPKVVI